MGRGRSRPRGGSVALRAARALPGIPRPAADAVSGQLAHPARRQALARIESHRGHDRTRRRVRLRSRVLACVQADDRHAAGRMAQGSGRGVNDARGSAAKISLPREVLTTTASAVSVPLRHEGHEETRRRAKDVDGYWMANWQGSIDVSIVGNYKCEPANSFSIPLLPFFVFLRDPRVFVVRTSLSGEIFAARSVAFLVSPDQHRLPDDVAFHRFLDVGLVRLLQVRQHDVERVEFVKVAMAADGRAGTSIAGALEIADALQRACG